MSKNSNSNSGKESVLKSSEIATFTKQQFLRSPRYSRFYDVISVCMRDDELLSHSALSEKIDSFMKGSVV